jgi:hypothetical protein
MTAITKNLVGLSEHQTRKLAKLDKGFDVSLVLSLGNFGGAKGIPVMINNNDFSAITRR